MGHNHIGSELHWLPTNYLVQWWKSTKYYDPEHDFIAELLQNRMMSGKEIQVPAKALSIWKERNKNNDTDTDTELPPIDCTSDSYRKKSFLKKRHIHYPKCTKPKEDVMDYITKRIIDTDPVVYGSELLASMPVLRVVVLREPISWLISKFFWHSSQSEGLQCDNYTDKKLIDFLSSKAMVVIADLCGYHCLAGHAKGTLSLDDLERMAAYNLRNSFSVVGLLHKSDEFNEMVTQRVHYMNMSLNPHIQGKRHSTGSIGESARCKEVYKDPDFQNIISSKSPAVQVINRLYQVGIEVNEFQRKELQECSSSSATTS
jgi:hypothetical protein